MHNAAFIHHEKTFQVQNKENHFTLQKYGFQGDLYLKDKKLLILYSKKLKKTACSTNKSFSNNFLSIHTASNILPVMGCLTRLNHYVDPYKEIKT